jgi:hypothetical protein
MEGFTIIYQKAGVLQNQGHCYPVPPWARTLRREAETTAQKEINLFSGTQKVQTAGRGGIGL